MAEPPHVTFVIAGVQKGGTTALFDYLGDYPDLALSEVKEVHFFDDETQDWAAPDYGAYHNLVHFNALGKGGHFAAWEQPQLFSEEVRTGFRSLRA